MREKKLGGSPNLFRRYCAKYRQNKRFLLNFARGAWGEFYKSWLKSNKFQFFHLSLPIVNLTV